MNVNDGSRERVNDRSRERVKSIIFVDGRNGARAALLDIMHETTCATLTKILAFARQHGNVARFGTGACVEIDTIESWPTCDPALNSPTMAYVEVTKINRVSSMAAAKIVLGY